MKHLLAICILLTVAGAVEARFVMVGTTPYLDECQLCATCWCCSTCGEPVEDAGDATVTQKIHAQFDERNHTLDFGGRVTSVGIYADGQPHRIFRWSLSNYGEVGFSVSTSWMVITEYQPLVVESGTYPYNDPVILHMKAGVSGDLPVLIVVKRLVPVGLCPHGHVSGRVKVVADE